ncbi:MAG: hypothetical protein Alpg2KO_14490 [Alphaproteobacteria bacterium]
MIFETDPEAIVILTAIACLCYAIMRPEPVLDWFWKGKGKLLLVFGIGLPLASFVMGVLVGCLLLTFFEGQTVWITDIRPTDESPELFRTRLTFLAAIMALFGVGIGSALAQWRHEDNVRREVDAARLESIKIATVHSRRLADLFNRQIKIAEKLIAKNSHDDGYVYAKVGPDTVYDDEIEKLIFSDRTSEFFPNKLSVLFRHWELKPLVLRQHENNDVSIERSELEQSVENMEVIANLMTEHHEKLLIKLENELVSAKRKSLED